VGDWCAWILVFYLPVANIVPLYPDIADRWLFTPEHSLYAPLAGMAVLIAIGVDRVCNRLRAAWRSLALASVGLIVLVGAARTVVRVSDWADEGRLFRSAVAAPDASPRVWYNYGNTLMREGAEGEAVAAYQQALERAPHDVEAWVNLGVALQRQGRIDDAIRAYRRAASVAAPSATLLENLGTALLAKGDVTGAQQAFAGALALDPQRPQARAALQAIGRANGR